ncbi:MAG: hypothetical protein Q7J09_07395 [Methanocalculus sp.]|uniref:hypothetical protein n=1 Tax=Methanocalculus sp. TaxID=2004547 RepID=UPI00271F60E6|nr:hypothetical protein [Methanocalculus sp.]MDO8840752.1 hypothetical protein [Methanocalculus sp.]MDO9539809.1 hypothetical protein [Methanocalculus sp.]
MDKKDGITFLIGIVFVIIVAVVIKPMATGESPDLSIPAIPGMGSPERTTPPTSVPGAVPLGQITIPHPSTVEGSGIGDSPTQVWDGKPIELGYVDPATYKLTQEEGGITSRRPVESGEGMTTLETYAIFEGKFSGTSQIFSIPFPRWELWYSITPSVRPIAEGASQAVGYPQFSITVMDAQDPGRKVGTLSPGGIIDDRGWSENDPRPWKQKFYEGGRSYYLVIDSRLIESYTIEIKVPMQ